MKYFRTTERLEISTPYICECVKVLDCLLADPKTFARLFYPLFLQFRAALELQQLPSTVTASDLHKQFCASGKIEVKLTALLPDTILAEAHRHPEQPQQTKIVLNSNCFLNNSPASYAEKCSFSLFALWALLHEVAHLLTPFFNELLGRPRDAAIPEQYGKLQDYSDKPYLSGDCGIAMEQLHLHGCFGGSIGAGYQFQLIKQNENHVWTRVMLSYAESHAAWNMLDDWSSQYLAKPWICKYFGCAPKFPYDEFFSILNEGGSLVPHNRTVQSLPSEVVEEEEEEEEIPPEITNMRFRYIEQPSPDASPAQSPATTVPADVRRRQHRRPPR